MCPGQVFTPAPAAARVLTLRPRLPNSPPAQAGADSTCGLLRMLQSAVDAMDAFALASHHEAVFAALLRALDLRRRRPAALLSPRWVPRCPSPRPAGLSPLHLGPPSAVRSVFPCLKS